MGPNIVPVLMASFIVMSLYAALNWLSLHATTVTVAQIFFVGVLFFALLIEADDRFGTTMDNDWLPGEASAAF